MGLKPETVERVREMWARSGDWIKNPGLVMIGDDVLLTVPPALRDELDGVEPTVAAVVARLTRDIPPAIHETDLLYADEVTMRPAPTRDVIRIADDDPRVALMGAAADRAEWSEASAGESAAARYARLDGNAIAAMATYRIRGETVGNIGVFTAASHRGRGWSGCVATACVEDIMNDGFVPQWQALVKNTASARVATKLGFERVLRRTMIRVYP